MYKTTFVALIGTRLVYWGSLRFPKVSFYYTMSSKLIDVVPTADKEHEDSLEFRQFRRQLFHSSLVQILLSLKPWMEKPRITQCGDGHLRRVIYGLGPYIADYPEQTLLACVVSGWCPKRVTIALHF
jgi:Plavaka transposase